MLDRKKVLALRLVRQHLAKKANEAEYIDLYRDTQPGQNVYWNGFGDPPSLSYRADFNDMEFNRERQRNRALIKGRFTGGNLGWIMPEDMELFACTFQKPLHKPTERQLELLDLIKREGPLNIQQMKETSGMLVKEITPALHRLQEAFLIYEDQYDGEWDRGWYKFPELFPDVDLMKYSRKDALKTLLKRFAYRQVAFDAEMAKSFYKLPLKEIEAAIDSLLADNQLKKIENSYIFPSDYELLQTHSDEPINFGELDKHTVFALHRNDFLVKSNEHILKEKYPHSHPDTLYYLLIDGEFHGAAVGKFRYTPEVLDVIVDLPADEAAAQKEEILLAIHELCGKDNPIKKYQGEPICTDQ